MRSMRPLKGFLSFVTPLLGALALLAEQGCTEANKSPGIAMSVPLIQEFA